MVELDVGPCANRIVLKEREEIRGIIGEMFVFINHRLHLWFPFDGDSLVCLAAVIMEIAVLEVGLFEICQVYERDTSEIEAHHEGILCHVTGWGLLEVELLDSFDCLKRNCSLACFVNTCIDSAEWVLLRYQFLLYRSVIDGSEDSHIEGTGIAAYVLLLKVCLVGFHQLCIYLAERQVLVLSESHKTVECGTIVLPCLVLSVLVKLGDDVCHEVDEGILGTTLGAFVVCHNCCNYYYLGYTLKYNRDTLVSFCET